MSYWNYRVCFQKLENNQTLYAIHEVMYEKNGNVYSISDSPARIAGNSEDTLYKNFAIYKDAFALPPINLDEFWQKTLSVH